MRLRGPGKYDEVAGAALSATGGSILLLVVGGLLGSGCSIKSARTVTDDLDLMPDLLRRIADGIELDLRVEASNKAIVDRSLLE